MTVKLFGVVLIISGFGAWGLMGAIRVKKRVQHLRAVRLAMNFLEKEITCMYRPLSQALARTGQFSDAPVAILFTESASMLHKKSGVTAGEAWQKGLQAVRKESDLHSADIKILAVAAQQLGTSNANEQKKLFSLLDEELRIQERKATQEMDYGSKLWTYGGFILGTVVVLLLL